MPSNRSRAFFDLLLRCQVQLDKLVAQLSQAMDRIKSKEAGTAPANPGNGSRTTCQTKQLTWSLTCGDLTRHVQWLQDVMCFDIVFSGSLRALGFYQHAVRPPSGGL